MPTNITKEITNKSFLAGILIGLGVIINTLMGPPLGPALFSFGLLLIIYMQLHLYTGKIGFLTKPKELPYLFTVLMFNLIGIGATIILYIIANPTFEELLLTAAAIKFSKNILTLFINAIFCGALIHFAVKNKQFLFTILAIMIFILISAEHCIADFPYFLFCEISFMNILKFLAIILGNSFGAIAIERLCKS